MRCVCAVAVLTKLRLIVTRVLPDAPKQSERLVDEVLGWIKAELPPDYHWPGNFRELEQCVRSVMVRGRYHPLRLSPDVAASLPERLARQMCAGQLTSDELLRHYYSLVLARSGTQKVAADRLGVVTRTLKKRLDTQLVEEYRSGGGIARTAGHARSAGAR